MPYIAVEVRALPATDTKPHRYTAKVLDYAPPVRITRCATNCYMRDVALEAAKVVTKRPRWVHTVTLTGRSIYIYKH